MVSLLPKESSQEGLFDKRSIKRISEKMMSCIEQYEGPSLNIGGKEWSVFMTMQKD